MYAMSMILFVIRDIKYFEELIDTNFTKLLPLQHNYVNTTRGICSAAWVGCYNGVLSNVVVFKEWSCRESADMCKRAHNRYAVVMTKAETIIVGHLPQKNYTCILLYNFKLFSNHYF